MTSRKRPRGNEEGESERSSLQDTFVDTQVRVEELIDRYKDREAVAEDARLKNKYLEVLRAAAQDCKNCLECESEGVAGAYLQQAKGKLKIGEAIGKLRYVGGGKSSKSGKHGRK